MSAKFAGEATACLHVDNSLVMNFLSSSLTILTEHQQLSSSVSEQFATQLRNLSHELGDPQGAQPVLNRLLPDTSGFIELLICRFGEASLTSNLFRYTVTPVLENLTKEASRLGSHLIARAELYLNREIVLDWHGVADGRQIYAAVLLDLCEVLEEVRHTTRDVLEGVRKFHPHVLAKGSTVDGNIDCGMAKALGFSEVRRVNTYLKSDDELLLRQAKVLERFSRVVFSIAERTSHYFPKGYDSVTVYCDLFTAEIKHFETLAKSYFRRANFRQSELRRRATVDALTKLRDRFVELGQAFTGHFADDVQMQPGFEHAFDIGRVDVKRRVVYKLISSGVEPGEAWRSCENLERYCEEKEADISEILPGEFQKIDKNLSDSLVDVFSSSGGPQDDENHQKESVLSRVTLLKKIFSEHLAECAPVIVMVFLMVCVSACGVKTGPKPLEPVSTTPPALRAR